MDLHEQLDKILSIISQQDGRAERGETNDIHYSIDTIFDVHLPSATKRERELIKVELYQKYKFIRVNSTPPHLTPDGLKFIREGGFTKRKTDADRTAAIQIKTLEKFEYDKYSFWMSVIALCVSIGALVVSLLKVRE